MKMYYIKFIYMNNQFYSNLNFRKNEEIKDQDENIQKLLYINLII